MPIRYAPGQALSCAQIRELDLRAIEQVGIPGVVLMENAGRGVAEFIYDVLVNPHRDRVLVLCGPGNNGGDGFVAARHLRNAGVLVDVALAAPRERSQGDAALNLRILAHSALPLVEAFEPAGLERTRRLAERAEVIVDALLGTGSKGPARGTVAELIRLANLARRARRIAIDIPSGLDGDSGEPSEPCFRAEATVTMLAPKAGFSRPGAGRYLGRVVVADIGLPRELLPAREDRAPGLDR